MTKPPDNGARPGGYDYDTFAADLDALLRHPDLRDVALVGFSMGAGEVARYIGRYGTERIAKTVFAGAVPPYLHKTDDNPDGGLDDATIQRERWSGSRPSAAPTSRDDLAKIDVPTLVIHGDSDAIVPFEVSGKRTAETVKGSETVVIEGGPRPGPGDAGHHAGRRPRFLG